MDSIEERDVVPVEAPETITRIPIDFGNDRPSNPTPNVLIIIDTQILGGPGKGLFQFLRHVKPGAMRYTICNFQYRNPRSTEFIDQAQRRGLNLSLLTQRFRFDPRPLQEVYKLARDGGFDIIQTHGYKADMIAWLLKPILKLPWIAFAHGWTQEDLKVKIYHRLDCQLLKRADRVIAVSPLLRETVGAVRGRRPAPILVPNAIDPSELAGGEGGAALREKLGVAPDEFLIGCFARLSFEKGHRFLLQALQRLRPNLRPKLVIVGQGPERENIERQIARENLSGRAFVLGHQRTMKDYFEAIDLLVLPSLEEGLPNVVLEAMAMAKPVIATNVGAVPQVITPGHNGWMIEPKNVDQLTAAITEAMSDRQHLREIAEAGQRSLFPQFAAEARAEKIVSVYHDVLGERRDA